MTQQDIAPVPERTLEQRELSDPHALHAALRADGAVHRVRLPTGLRVWLVTDHAAARAVLADPTMSKDMRGAGALFDRHTDCPAPRKRKSPTLAVNMLGSDPPDHTRLRRLVSRAFTPQQVAALRPGIEESAHALLDDMAHRDGGDLLELYANPLSITVICALLGVPEQDRVDFAAWSRALLDQDPAGRARMREAATATRTYLTDLIAAKRANPGDDLLSALVQARADDALSEDELVATALLLLLAGFETTVNLIGNGMHALLTDPGQLALVQGDPDTLPAALEEILRFDGPANHTSYRYTTRPVDIAGTTVPEGEFVLVSLSAANRDPARFPDPDRLDVCRDTGGHLGFGHGIHYCLGAPLARLEGEVALRLLLRRLPHIRLAVPPHELVWRPSTLVRALEALPVTWSTDDTRAPRADDARARSAADV
ncbi:cytochrome P450 [Streptomyces sp. NPDC021093]|uniref:cytochrome P450 n=1 Tax=Streptomyces sp. NPDC021093 TaxID=3365112 RepID=UPI00379434A1